MVQVTKVGLLCYLGFFCYQMVEITQKGMGKFGQYQTKANLYKT